MAMPVPVAQCVDKAAIGNAGIHGIELLTDKHSLSRVGRLLGWEGRFVPETAMSVGHDTLEWLAKRGSHRGVYPLAAAGRERSLAEQPPAELLVQRRVAPPLLIDDRAWDLGVYAVLEKRLDGSISAALFDDVLLRFCTMPYLHTAAAQVCASAPSATCQFCPMAHAAPCPRLLSRARLRPRSPLPSRRKSLTKRKP
jgi:hypothetical protein